MSLSSDLISQFVKVTNDEKKPSTEATVYGTVVIGDRTYVRIDGSDQLTPVSTTTNVKDDDRVSVLIKDHSATITGNITSPAAGADDVYQIGDQVSEFEIVIADKVSTGQLEAEIGRVESLTVDKFNAVEANFDTLYADVAEIEELKVDRATVNTLVADTVEAKIAEFEFAEIENLEAINAEINNLKVTYVEVTGKLTAQDVEIKNLKAEQLTVESLEGKFANIDFANITQASIENLFVKTGMMENVIISEGTVTGQLVAVKFKGDLIEAGTIKADRLILKNDEDGLYYRLNIEGGATVTEKVTEEDLQNGLSGSIIIAESITAEKINVDDLSAFNATIGGIEIGDGCIYSGVKASVDNTTDGFYLDSIGQMALGNSVNYVKFFKDTDGTYKLAIAADSFVFSSTGMSVEEAVDASADSVNNSAATLTDQAVETSKAYVNDSLKDYVGTPMFSEYQEAIANELKTLADEVAKVAQDNEANKNAIDKNTNDINSTKNELTKHFEFKTDGLTIRAGDNSTSLTLDSDDISFSKAQKQSGTWDGDDFYTRNVIIKPDAEGNTYRLQLGSFAFMPRKNGSLTFGKVQGSNTPVEVGE